MTAVNFPGDNAAYYRLRDAAAELGVSIGTVYLCAVALHATPGLHGLQPARREGKSFFIPVSAVEAMAADKQLRRDVGRAGRKMKAPNLSGRIDALEEQVRELRALLEEREHAAPTSAPRKRSAAPR